MKKTLLAIGFAFTAAMVHASLPSWGYGNFSGYGIAADKPMLVDFTVSKAGAVKGTVIRKGKEYSFKATATSVSSTKLRFRPSIKIGSKTYKPFIYVKKTDNGVKAGYANGSTTGFRLIRADRRQSFIRNAGALSHVLGFSLKVLRDDVKNTALKKSSDYVKFSFSATDFVRISGKFGGKSIASYKTRVQFYKVSKGKSNAAYYGYVPVIDYALGYSRVVKVSFKVDKEGLLYAVDTTFSPLGTDFSHDLYCVVDLSDGSQADKYPVTYLKKIPSDGWTSEHRTKYLVLRYVAPGSFKMGSPESELGRNKDETRHSVKLKKGFWIGIFEMTADQYWRVMGKLPAGQINTQFPVHDLSYQDIRGGQLGAQWPPSSAVDSGTFLSVLRSKTGLAGLDLPTEAQWEYACRAGTTTALNNGRNLTVISSVEIVRDPAMEEVGFYAGNSGGYLSKKAGSFQPNAWGIYDMHGNAAEWCLDYYDAYREDATDPVGPYSGILRVQRGGGGTFSAEACRSAARKACDPRISDSAVGFRVCCPAD